MRSRKTTGPDPSPLHEGAKLAIIGGRFEHDNHALFAAMRELARGRIAVLPTASSAPGEVGDEACDSFRAHGFAAEVIPLDKDNHRTAAFDPTLVERLERFGSFYFTGGDQTLIVRALVQDGRATPALEAIRRCWREGGGLVAGSSAGAAVMSDPMILSGGSVEALAYPPVPEPHDTRLGLGPGLGFFPYGLVDQHFLERGRLGRLVAAMLATGHRLGFGIDENTAMVIAHGRLRVVGETGLILVDLSRATGAEARVDIDRIKLSYLDRGDSVELATMAVTPGPDKRRVRRSERYYRAPARVGKPAFAGYTVHELIARLVEADTSAYRTETAWAYDHASGTEVALQLTRARRSKALIETGPEGTRVTALDLLLRLGVRRASSKEHYRHRALGALVDPAALGAGRLVLLGGPLTEDPPELIAELRGLVAGPVGIIATASAEPREVAARMVGLLGRHGIEAVDLGATRANLRHEAKQRAMVERMAGLGGFLITGGNQRRLVEALLYRGEESAVLHALTLAWQRGATIIAASGGAAALSPLMIAGGSSREALRFGVAPDATHPGLLIEPGLGLFGAGLLDQNMVGAQRLGRLIVACAEEAVPLGFGLCEEGGLVVEADRRMRVIGRRGVILVEVDPQRLTFEDDLFTLRGVKLSMVPPQDWIGPAGPVVAPRRVGDGVGPSLAELLAALEHEAAFGRSRQGRVRIRTRALAAHAAELDIEACRTD